MSRTRSPGPTRSSSVIRPTMYGWLIVWPASIGSASSEYADLRRSGVTNSSRGTTRMAARTASSRTPRARSWTSTIRVRSVRRPSSTPWPTGGGASGPAGGSALMDRARRRSRSSIRRPRPGQDGAGDPDAGAADGATEAAGEPEAAGAPDVAGDPDAAGEPEAAGEPDGTTDGSADGVGSGDGETYGVNTPPVPNRAPNPKIATNTSTVRITKIADARSETLIEGSMIVAGVTVLGFAERSRRPGVAATSAPPAAGGAPSVAPGPSPPPPPSSRSAALPP